MGTHIDSYDILRNEPRTFGVGFAKIPGAVDPVTHMRDWITFRFDDVMAGVSWLRSVNALGGYVYAAIYTRMDPTGPLMEFIGPGPYLVDVAWPGPPSPR